MQFLKKSHAHEIEDSLEKNIEEFYAQDQKISEARLQETISYLHQSANLLDQVGLEKEAAVITAILASFAETDPAMVGLTSDKMVNNLKEKGWVFNADDASIQDLNDYLAPAEDAPEAITEIVVEEETPKKTANWWILNKK